MCFVLRVNVIYRTLKWFEVQDSLSSIRMCQQGGWCVEFTEFRYLGQASEVVCEFVFSKHRFVCDKPVVVVCV